MSCREMFEAIDLIGSLLLLYVDLNIAANGSLAPTLFSKFFNELLEISGNHYSYANPVS